MRLLLTFIIFIFGGFYTFGDNNCCEQCCEYLKNCCNKGKVKVEDLVNGNWLNSKKSIVLKIFNKDENENENENEYKSGDITIKLEGENENTKIAELNKVKIKLRTNGQKWAFFKITYKKGKNNEEKETVLLYCSDVESSPYNGIFNACEQHLSISVMDCDTSGVTDMKYMFSNCTSLSKLDLTNFNTETVTCMCSMFSGCNSLQTLDLSNFNTNKVTNMNFMFSECKTLQTLDLSNFKTDNVKNMRYMFYGCDNLKTLNLPNSKISKDTEIVNMFDSCNVLHTVIFNEEQQVDKNLPNNNVPQDKVNLQEKIEDQLKKLGQWDKQEKENKITLGKKPQT